MTSDDAKQALIRLFIDQEVLRFGEFTLKSGRRSPYFFNLGALCTGAALRQLADAYADRVLAAGEAPEVLFGPAYKGIPLAAAVGTALAARGLDLGITFNRKEAKDHGEGGQLVGAPLAGRSVLILDDVLTAGTAMREAVGFIRAAGGVVAGVLIAMDRQERATASNSASSDASAESAVESLAQEIDVPVEALITLTDLVRFLDASSEGRDASDTSGSIGSADLRARMVDYQKQHGIVSL